MTVKLFTDPHLGLKRAVNTTSASREKLTEMLYTRAMAASTGSDFTVCLGDLLDRFSSEEKVIRQAAHVVDRCDLVIAGNHDLIPRQDKVSTLQLLSDSYPGTILLPKFNEPCAENTILGHVAFTAIPHVLTQELFDRSVDTAIAQGPTHIEGQTTTSACLLHCNYESPYELTETTLNLTEARAEGLLEVYDTVFLGHEHIPREKFGGRLIIIGNTFPTGFSDISNKRVIVMDGDGIHSEQVWSMADHYREVDASQLEGADLTDLQFLRITGDVKPELMASISKMISKYWRGHGSLFAIKLDVNILNEHGEIQAHEPGTFDSLPDQIEKELEGTKLAPYWKEFRDE